MSGPGQNPADEATDPTGPDDSDAVALFHLRLPPPGLTVPAAAADPVRRTRYGRCGAWVPVNGKGCNHRGEDFGSDTLIWLERG
ncbi:hypothetical protein GCM10023322_74780 [Rugosimonospora acidiphila]|uniref:Uncharacterized protein n=1 Tax=Rugosimonospora acidiphila TaxID=556531 RepID=A0ABP9SMV8_9ACTN